MKCGAGGYCGQRGKEFTKGNSTKCKDMQPKKWKSIEQGFYNLMWTHRVRGNPELKWWYTTGHISHNNMRVCFFIFFILV